MKLYNYFRSSASFRVRIALELKGLRYDYVAVNLLKGEQQLPAFAGRLGAALVPALELDDGRLLAQSMAIIEYLDETHPAPALLPADAIARAQVRALAQLVACEIHPLNNLRVLKYLKHELKVDDAAKDGWYRHWVRQGLQAFERQLDLLDAGRQAAGLPASRLCWGDAPTLADCCLVPQIFNAQRFNVELADLPRTMAAFEACMQLAAFQRAQPSACPDHEG
ncbi:MAG: maleylacetoacetate isomerase [Proteobacteria bacterium]|nr:maleylacetoacetate isomerase [Pseudomonadota bacterium]